MRILNCWHGYFSKIWLLGEAFEAKLSTFSKNYFPLPQSTYFVIAPTTETLKICLNRCEICSKMTKAPEKRRSDVFIANFGHYFASFFSFSCVDFVQVHVHWVGDGDWIFPNYWLRGLVTCPYKGKVEVNTANIYLFKVKNRNTRKRCEVCSKLTVKIPKRRHWRRSGILLLTLDIRNTYF